MAVKGSYISSNTYWYKNGNLDKKKQIESGNKSVQLDNPGNVRTRGWMLTIPADNMAFETLDNLLSSIANKDSTFAAKFSIECGKNTGYKHYQMFLYWRGMKTGSAVMNLFPSVHIEPSISIKDSIQYVSKDDTHIAGPFIYGIADQVFGMMTDNDVSKRDLYDAAYQMITEHGYRYDDFISDPHWRRWSLTHKQAIMDMDSSYSKSYYSTHIRNVSVDYIYGPTRTGKTTTTLQMYGGSNVFIADMSSSFPFDGYAGEPVLLLDDYRSDFKFSYLLRILQGQPFRVNVKGSSTYARWTKVVITSNLSLAEQYPNLDERKDPLYRRFDHGIVFMKMSFDEALPYASREDAMFGKPCGGYPNGDPNWSFDEAVSKYDDTAWKPAGYVPHVRNVPDDITINGDDYWNIPAVPDPNPAPRHDLIPDSQIDAMFTADPFDTMEE